MYACLLFRSGIVARKVATIGSGAPEESSLVGQGGSPEERLPKQKNRPGGADVNGGLSGVRVGKPAPSGASVCSNLFLGVSPRATKVGPIRGDDHGPRAYRPPESTQCVPFLFTGRDEAAYAFVRFFGHP